MVRLEDMSELRGADGRRVPRVQLAEGYGEVQHQPPIEGHVGEGAGMKRRTGSRTLTVHNVSLDEAFEIIHKAFKDKESDQDEKVIETCNIQITHKRRKEDGPERD